MHLNMKAGIGLKLFLMIFAISAVLICNISVYGKQEIRNSVVKIHTTQRLPDVFKPWSKTASDEISGSGVVISGNRILTNAHVVTYASQIYVQPYQSADRIPADIIGIAPGIDLAILKLEDKDFFKNHPALPMDDTIPKPGDKVKAYGYPMGGTGLSETEGIVSRVEFTPYYYDTSGLRIQVDAALNPGNSGGPVISNGKIVGIVFSNIRQADNIGYVIPVEEIKLFLNDLQDGKYGGKPMMFDELQTLENSALREKLGLKKGQTGVMVNEPYDNSGKGLLKKWDVITHIGSYNIDNAGKIITDDGFRLNFAYMIQHLEKNGKINLTIIRDGKRLKVDFPLLYKRSRLVPYLMGRYPSYYIYGPLVFSPATNDFLRYLNRAWRSRLIQSSSPLITRLNDKASKSQKQLIIISSSMFPSRITKGYSDPFAEVVKTINGKKIKDMKDLVEVIKGITGPYVEISFAGDYVETMIFRKDQMDAATENILTENGIRFQASKDLRNEIKDLK